MKTLTLLLLLAVVVFARQKAKGKGQQQNTINVYAGYMADLGDGIMGMSNLMFPTYITLNTGDILNINNIGDEHQFAFGTGVNATGYVDAQNNVYPAGFGSFNLGSAVSGGPWAFDGISLTVTTVLLEGQSIAITINAPAGVYQYRCLFHPLMIGYIKVLDPNSKVKSKTKVSSNADIRDAILAQQELADANLEMLYEAASSPIQDPNVPAYVNWEVYLGYGNGLGSLLAFIPNTLNISVGDTIRFINYDPYQPHSVTFDAGGSPIADGTNGQDFTVPDNSTAFASDWVDYGYAQSGTAPPFTIAASAIDITFNGGGYYFIYCGVHGPIMDFQLWVN